MDGWLTEWFVARDKTALAFHRKGEGAPVVMIHGFLSSSARNWIDPGIADAVLRAGFEVVALDLRGHGQSDAPLDRARWPIDILAEDALALISHLGLPNYDLVGYSLGARTTVRMMARGARPRRAVLGGMGASGVMQAGARAAMFEDAILHGDKARDPVAGRTVHAMIEAGGFNPEAMLGVLASFTVTSEVDLRAIPVPTLVVSGDRDSDNGSAEALASILPQGQAQRIPGNHLTAVGAPLGTAIVDFLAA
jgi:pimeloyl-ACP methyl ester carboxylesterase